MAPPRFQVVISAGGSVDRDQMVPDSAATATVSWRLLGSNHRELGRSGQSFEDIDDCLHAISDLRGGIDNVDSQVMAHSTVGTWFWRIHLSGLSVAVSSRLYQRRRESAQSLARALESIRLVDRDPFVLRLRRTGSQQPRRALKGRTATTKIVDLRDHEVRMVPRIPPRAGNQI